MTADALRVLHGHRYLRLTTFRRDGRAVPTPVWFAEDGGCWYVMTVAHSGKVKRVRHTPRVEVAPCDARGRPLGPSLVATARVLPPTAAARVEALLNRKYGLVKRGFDLLLKLRRVERAYLELCPATSVDDPARSRPA